MIKQISGERKFVNVYEVIYKQPKPNMVIPVASYQGSNKKDVDLAFKLIKSDAKWKDPKFHIAVESFNCKSVEPVYSFETAEVISIV